MAQGVARPPGGGVTPDRPGQPGVGQHCVLTLSCPDTLGIVHAVSGFLVQHGCTIRESQQFEDPDSGTFFMRVQFARADGATLDVDQLRGDFSDVSVRFGMTWRMVDASEHQRVIIMVSRFAHCLNDLLFRTSVGELNLDVVAVVSNHPDLGRLADNYDVPFRHIPVTPDTKAEAEAALLELVRTERVDLVVLARYMQILSDETCKQLEGRAINIHHSMLPSFKGARPYHQAHARGVKVIGATAHYVTGDLDEGPIIEQELMRVDHTMSADEFAAHGREVECRALARAVRWHTENRVALNGTKTVVLQ
ncbi:formyltetrahydrofolate deformylase [Pseudonocardia sp. DSM 110487]|nr:formyltetrahydrofolate deformylase [Pseudonocardia sp. DSM 110487]